MLELELEVTWNWGLWNWESKLAYIENRKKNWNQNCPLLKKLEPKLNPIFEKKTPKPNQNQSLRKCYELELRGPPGTGELVNTG
jgi:hypothetical protein